VSKRVVQFQRAQLVALSGTHFVVDMFSNMLPPILPAVRRHFGLSLFQGSILVVVLLLSSNWFQLAAGHLRSGKNDRTFLYVGLVLAACVGLMGLIPSGPQALWLLCGLAVITGMGIAMVHPDSLRAVHTLDRIAPAATTALFMASGFLGFAFAGWASTCLVERWDLRGLYPLLACPLAVIVAIKALRVRLAVDDSPDAHQSGDQRPQGLPFWAVMAMAVPSAMATTLVTTLLPTRLVDELGFSLTFGGLSTTVYGLGGALGAVLWARLALRKGELACVIWALALAVPLLAAYLAFMSSRAAIVLLFGVGFFSVAAYILMITLARNATGVNLSMRMATIVGGTWGASNLAFLPLARLAETTGTWLILGLAPMGYLGAAAWGVLVWRRRKNAGGRKARCSWCL
jgi:FSR family fosmidomycin resistance protein-like MFS transporter